ncbi:MAG: AAA family ATPase [Kiritimatiellae bacterium]|nr:AAA family ATPase [Kiritimatiellia bacterium]
MSDKNLQIPYGVFNFKTIRTEGLYYVDKTGYIPLLENAGRFLFFVRPRRFGKSLMASMLRCYYDIAEKDNFDALFGGLEIAKNPTANRNRYLVLSMDFSEVNKGMEPTLQERFNSYVGTCLTVFLSQYGSLYGADALAEIKKNDSPAVQFNLAVKFAKAKGLPLYLMLDEYDNFTNAMLRAEGNEPYRGITHGSGFYREWFKSFKSSFDRIYMTGVSPVTMDDLTSGFNIAANISQNPRFNAMLGFEEREVLRLYEDFKGVGEYLEGDPADWVRSFKPWYDGYCFSPRKTGRESVFNSDMVLYHLSALVDSGEPPEDMVDKNIKTDYDKLQTIADIQHLQYRQRNGGSADGDTGEDVLPLTEVLAATGQISFDLVESFPADDIAEEENFRSLFHYYGILSMAGREKGQTVFKIPNACVERQLFGYLRKAYRRTRPPSWLAWGKLASAMAYDGEWRPFLERLASDLRDTQPVRGAIDREIRIQGYMQCEFGHLNFYLARPEMELGRGYCDFCLFPERVHFGDVKHSYIVELKHAPADATNAVLDAQYRDALEQLAKYRADKSVPTLARDTTLHQIVFQFRGDDMIRCEQIAEEQM